MSFYCNKCEKNIDDTETAYGKHAETICQHCGTVLMRCEHDNREIIDIEKERSKPMDGLNNIQTKTNCHTKSIVTENGDVRKVIDDSRHNTNGKSESQRENAKREIKKIAESYGWGSNIQNTALLIYETYKCQKEKEIKNRPMKIIAAAALFMANQLAASQENRKKDKKGASVNRYDNKYVSKNKIAAPVKTKRRNQVPVIMQNWLTPEEIDYYQEIGEKLIKFSSEISVRNGTTNSNPFLKQLKDISTHVRIDAMITTEDYLKQCTTIFGFTNKVTDYNLEIYRQLQQQTAIKDEASLKNSALVIELLRGILEDINIETKKTMPKTQDIAAMLGQNQENLRSMAEKIRREKENIIIDIREKICKNTNAVKDAKVFSSKSVIEQLECKENTQNLKAQRANMNNSNNN